MEVFFVVVWLSVSAKKSLYNLYKKYKGFGKLKNELCPCTSHNIFIILVNNQMRFFGYKIGVDDFISRCQKKFRLAC